MMSYFVFSQQPSARNADDDYALRLLLVKREGHPVVLRAPNVIAALTSAKTEFPHIRFIVVGESPHG